ncbi:DUF4272 domain-containing protein [Alteromonas oceanisediminis]|uniref:DUF4272 domain-containing protein n=1 Tax=Alteromonas oceanisediminis TaxID=2836180 RepID=UPI001BD9D9DE|nr:DUF4272 domain-containing protein [Alteromonas oceanisediminis]MBT0585400.1 DUF4272 domain-containing protein [Alteromonas oceanisediminis]
MPAKESHGLIPHFVVVLYPRLKTNKLLSTTDIQHLMFFSRINPQKIKKKNTKTLSKLGIIVPEHLPALDIPKFRSAHEVAERCVVLAVLLQSHFGATNEFVSSYLKQNNLMRHLTEEETALLGQEYNKWEDQTKIDLYWSIEAIWALTWCGGYHGNLTFNSEVEDSLASYLPSFVDNEPAQDFLNSFTLRSEKEIIEKLDAFYRAHWFCRHSQMNNKATNLVNMDIIIERRKSLEWVCYAEESWDEICLDT